MCQGETPNKVQLSDENNENGTAKNEIKMYET